MITSDGRGKGSSAPRSGTLAHLIAGREELPTVTISGNHNAAGASANSGDGLATVARRSLSTVVATDYKGATTPGQRRWSLSGAVPGQLLSADFCEWHMGAPGGWGRLEPLPAGAVESWVRAAREGTLWPELPPMTCTKGAEPRRAARIRQAGNAWVPLCAAVAFEALARDLEDAQ